MNKVGTGYSMHINKEPFKIEASLLMKPSNKDSSGDHVYTFKIIAEERGNIEVCVFLRGEMALVDLKEKIIEAIDDCMARKEKDERSSI